VRETKNETERLKKGFAIGIPQARIRPAIPVGVAPANIWFSGSLH
jgi:hypothetical protein